MQRLAAPQPPCTSHALAGLRTVPGGMHAAAASLLRTPTWCVQAVREKGAMVEAAAPMTLGAPSAALFIEPTGAVKVIATMERVFQPAYTTVGHVFPQVSVTHSALADAATAVGDSLVGLGFMGAAMPSSWSRLVVLTVQRAGPQPLHVCL